MVVIWKPYDGDEGKILRVMEKVIIGSQVFGDPDGDAEELSDVNGEGMTPTQHKRAWLVAKIGSNPGVYPSKWAAPR